MFLLLLSYQVVGQTPKKISEYAAASSLVGTEETIVNQGGVTRKATVDQIRTGLVPLSFKTGLDALNGIIKSNGSGVYSTITDNSSNWNTAFGWGNHAGLYRPISYVPAWSDITSKPTTIAGYGITDFNTLGDARYPQLSGTYNNPTWLNQLAWSKITTTPTTIAGYGITDYNSLGDSRWGRLASANTWTGNNAFRNTTRTETGTSYTVQASDEGLTLQFTNSSEVTLTLPNSLPQYFSVYVKKWGTGDVVIEADGTLVSVGTPTLTTQYSGAFIEHLGGNEWEATGPFGSGGGGGDVVGPSSATDNAVARYNTTTGKLLQNSGLIVDDNGDLTFSSPSTRKVYWSDIAGGGGYAKIEYTTTGTSTGELLIESGAASGETGNVVVRPRNSGSIIFDVGTPSAGQIWTHTFGGAGEWADPVEVNVSPDIRYEESTDFISITSGSYIFASASNGAGSGIVTSSYGVNSTENAFGVLSMLTGTTTTGESHLWYGGGGGPMGVRFGSQAITQLWRIAIDAVSDGTNTYSVSFGFGEQIASKDQQDGAYFTYTHGTNGGRWQCVTAAGGTRTTNDSGVSASTSFQQFRIEVNQAGTEVLFYIDAALVATHTTNIPTNGTNIMANIVKSAGTTSRTIYADYYKLITTRSTSR